MSDRPILFSAPMIRALLAGTKTQTRRILTRNNSTVLGHSWRGKSRPWEGLRFKEAVVRETSGFSGSRDPHLAVPFCHPGDTPTPSEDCGIYTVRPLIELGDRLWARETWTEHHPAGIQPDRFSRPGRAGIPGPPGVSYRVIYRADGDPLRVWHCEDYPYRATEGPRDETDAKFPEVCSEFPGWQPSIFMPRWASRLTLSVTDVRVQRLQDISERDAIAEGVIRYDPTDEDPAEFSIDGPIFSDAVSAYEDLWLRINGAGSWDTNPWVVALTFTVERRNIDEAPAA